MGLRWVRYVVLPSCRTCPGSRQSTTARSLRLTMPSFARPGSAALPVRPARHASPSHHDLADVPANMPIPLRLSSRLDSSYLRMTCPRPASLGAHRAALLSLALAMISFELTG